MYFLDIFYRATKKLSVVPRKWFGSADCDTADLPPFTLTADPNPFRLENNCGKKNVVLEKKNFLKKYLCIHTWMKLSKKSYSKIFLFFSSITKHIFFGSFCCCCCGSIMDKKSCITICNLEVENTEVENSFCFVSSKQINIVFFSSSLRF